MSKRRFYARPRWRNPGKAYVPRTKAQERKYKTPKAFTVRAEWKYGNARTDEREARIRQQARRALGVAGFFERITRRIFPGWKPAIIDSDIYQVEA